MQPVSALHDRASLLRRAVWVMLAAVLLGTLAPAVSRGLAAAEARAGWVEVCTAGGTKRIPTGDSDPQSPAHAALGDHCGYCRLQSDQPFALPDPPAQSLPAGGWTQRRPVAAPAVPRGAALWPCPLSRAPPRLY